VEQLGAWSGTEGVQALPQLLLELIRTHEADYGLAGQRDTPTPIASSTRASALAACSVTAWTACSRISRSRPHVVGGQPSAESENVIECADRLILIRARLLGRRTRTSSAITSHGLAGNEPRA
jgi:hypothetical protein